MTSAVKAEWLAGIRRVEQICTDAADFPTVAHLDAMLDELRYLPQTAGCTALEDLLLDMRLDLVTGAPPVRCPAHAGTV